ncbi:MAG: ABC transporter ATP-binding protein [Lachnospiraceae bacterium]|nr:ABC transporter ATP-binding protein [Lachnospiraceae bacterium]
MKRWFKYIKPYLAYFIVGPLLMIVEVLGEVFMPKFFANIINGGVSNQDVGYIVSMGILMIATSLLMVVGGVGGAYFGAKASINFGKDIRRDAYRKVQEFSFSNIDKFSTGSLVTRLTNDITQLQNFVDMCLRMMLRAPGMLIGALIMALQLNARLALVLCIAIPIMVAVMVFVVFRGFPRFKIMQEKIDALNTNVQENITNVRVIKSFVRDDYEKEKFFESNANLKKSGLYAMNLMILIMPTMSLVMNFSSLAVLWFGGKMVMVGTMKLGDLTAFVTYITQILSSLMMVSMIFLSASRAAASSKRLGEVLDEKVDISDVYAEQKDKQVQEGRIEFRNVSFRYYKNSEEKVLDNINVTIEPGSIVGIIGSTGCGKTTLVSMIPRLYDVDEGEVLVDGVNVKDYSLFNLREAVGMVLQKNVLFSGSVKKNMLWGDPNATDEEITAACKNAQADDFVRAHKDGYERELGQGGVNVSGGQKQRLCIARALLKHPKILILDDSTSAVDTATEARIRESFHKELKDTTKIIIAQRISSVKDANTIIVMDEGKITGMGTHEELLASNEEYQEIYYSQMDRKEAQ